LIAAIRVLVLYDTAQTFPNSTDTFTRALNAAWGGSVTNNRPPVIASDIHILDFMTTQDWWSELFGSSYGRGLNATLNTVGFGIAPRVILESGKLVRDFSSNIYFFSPHYLIPWISI